MTDNKKQVANRRMWDSKNMATVSTRVRREVAEKFASITNKHHTTPNEVLREFVMDYIVSDGHPEQVVNKWPWNKHE